MQPGTRLDQYEIVDQLGEGGMGAVYRARDTRLKRDVAIKVLPPELATDPERLARLEREAQLLASLNHPNVATVHGFGDVETDVDGTRRRVTFLVMELIGGESLHDRVAMGPIPWQEAVRITIGIASGLEAAHERGIVHRDLKPANVHVDDEGTVKVLDFGLAKAFEGEAGSGSLELSASPTMAAATRTGMILGTAAYMSPEQARGKVVDKRADIWALGCVLYEMLAGTKAFRGETVSDILAAILKEDPDESALPAIPESLRQVLRRCLVKQPGERMRDVGDVRLELTASLDDPVGTRAADTAGSGSTGWRVAAVATLLALAIGFGVGQWWRTPEPPRAEIHATVAPDSKAMALNALAVSPDERWIAESNALGGGGIRLRRTNDRVWRDIPETIGALSLQFSATSDALYFTRGFFDEQEATLERIDLTGSSAVTVANLPLGFSNVLRGLNGELFVSLHDPPSYTLYQVEANGSLVEIVSGEIDEFAPIALAQIDASRWLIVRSRQNGSTGLGSLDASNGEITPFLDGLGLARYLGNGRILAIDPRGRLVSARIDPDTGQVIEAPVVRIEGMATSPGLYGEFDVTESGSLYYVAGAALSDEQTLGWLDFDGDFTPLSSRTGSFQVDSFPSPDGRFLAVEMQDPEDSLTSIWIHDVERDVRTPLVPGADTAFPVWSPDGSAVAYRLGGSDNDGIYRAPIDRSEAPELLLAKPDDRWVLPMDWHPDGTSILYVDSNTSTRQNNDTNAIWLLPVDGSAAQAVVADGASAIDPRFSPDGRWIAYVSDRTGRYEVFVRPLAGGGDFQISAEGGLSPEWNPTGGQLFFEGSEQIRVVDIDLSGATPGVSSERPLVEIPANAFRAGGAALWAPAPSGDRILIASYESGSEGRRSVEAIFNWSLLQDWQ